MTDKPLARLVSQSDRALVCCAAAARLSTTPGTAYELTRESGDGDRDRALVRKVLSCGHQSVVEHCALTFALDGISALAEQFLIESRLCSFTVKSRRYVDFKNAGFYQPELSQPLAGLYREAMLERFGDYARLTELGVPREDARFVLPYCFHSNMLLSGNAREIALLIGHLCYGRGREYPELMALGQEMKEQFEPLFPGVLRALEGGFSPLALPAARREIADCAACEGGVALVSAPEDGRALLREAMAFAGRMEPDDFQSLVRDARPRELELLQYVFKFENVSLPCVTHIARHRMQSPLFEMTLCALNRQKYVLPMRIAGNDAALAVYRAAFEAQRAAVQRLAREGLPTRDLSYLALSGLTVDVMSGMNARELLHFLKLRTCTRAQWEIRELALKMLDLLRERDAELFSLYGPSCFVTGRCPEGKLSCGRAPTRA